jgi:putative transposase
LFDEEKAFAEVVMDAWTEFPTYGYLKMSMHLKRNGHPEATEKRVRRIYRLMGLQGLSPVFKTTRNGKRKGAKFPYLLRNRKISFVNEVYATDITYIKLPGGMVYFTVVIDLYSRKILSWRLSNTMDKQFCIDCVSEAFEKYGEPAIFNTDAGTQYTSNEFVSLLKDHKIRISMDGIGRCLDNVFIERTFRTLKYECIFLHDYNTMTELSNGLKAFIEFFNNERLHQGLDYQTPNEVYEQGCFPIGKIDIQVA